MKANICEFTYRKNAESVRMCYLLLDRHHIPDEVMVDGKIGDSLTHRLEWFLSHRRKVTKKERDDECYLQFGDD